VIRRKLYGLLLSSLSDGNLQVTDKENE